MPPTEDTHAFSRLHHRVPRLERATSALVVVDIQAQLAPHIADVDALVLRTQALIAAARLLLIPIVATEHCADRIGPLVAPVRAMLLDNELFAKTRFSAADEPDFLARLARTSRSQVVVAGMEAHVCAMQTALGIVAAGYDVFVVGDATGSRVVRQQDRAFAFERMRAAGCVLAGTETVLFEWAGSGDDPVFRELLAIVKRLP